MNMSAAAFNPHSTPALVEADRLMTICNSCRYCEGLCAVFPAMEMRRSFTDGDLNYLANLCHACGACYVDCQFSPPHEFAVNVPKTLAEIRGDSYQDYAWPGTLSGLFSRNGVAAGLIVAVGVAAFVLGFITGIDPSVLFAVHTGPGAFSRLMPHNTVAMLFGSAFLYAVLAVSVGIRAFWHDIGASGHAGTWPLWQAVKDACLLRYLDGGGAGCVDGDEKPDGRRRAYHHLTMYGFLLCFAATSVGTLYHYLLGLEAPYAWYDLPVMLGSLGGIGLIIGPAGLFAARARRHPALIDQRRAGMDVTFTAVLFLAGLTGLALLALRATPLMGTLLCLHLGVVFGLFVTMPYGKFVHGLYRFAALVRYARERAGKQSDGPGNDAV
jgi:citrate/tricarballylate utilization protein